MHFLQAINSDLSVLIVCNKTGGTIKRRYKKIYDHVAKTRSAGRIQIHTALASNSLLTQKRTSPEFYCIWRWLVLATGLDALEKVKILAAVWSRNIVHGSPACCLRAILAKPSRVPSVINPYPTAFPYGNGMVLHFYQQQESSTTKTVHKVINKGLKTYV